MIEIPEWFARRKVAGEAGRARRWTQAGAVREALWGRRHGDPEGLIGIIDRLAGALT